MAGELGSSVRNIVKYTKLYSGGIPEFKENDILKTIIPLNVTKNYIENYMDDLNNTQKMLLELIAEKPNITQEILMKKIKFK